MPPSALGEFEVVVLLAVLHLDGRAYGSAIRDEIERRTGHPVARGAVYVTLDRLEEKRLLRSAVGDASAARGGRPRRYFQASAKGLRAVRASIARLERMRAGLDPLLDTP